MKEYKKPMTVQELRDYLDELISKRKFIGHMTVGFWVPELELEDDYDEESEDDLDNEECGIQRTHRGKTVLENKKNKKKGCC